MTKFFRPHRNHILSSRPQIEAHLSGGQRCPDFHVPVSALQLDGPVRVVSADLVVCSRDSTEDCNQLIAAFGEFLVIRSCLRACNSAWSARAAASRFLASSSSVTQLAISPKFSVGAAIGISPSCLLSQLGGVGKSEVVTSDPS